jgi:hypothetical protein
LGGATKYETSARFWSSDKIIIVSQNWTSTVSTRFCLARPQLPKILDC